MQQLVMGDEVLDVAGGFAFDLAIRAVCPSRSETVNLTIAPTQGKRELEAALADKFELAPSLHMMLAASGTLGEPGAVQRIGAAFELAHLASQFCSLLVLVDEAQRIEQTTVHVHLPLRVWAASLDEDTDSLPIEDRHIEIPCTTNLTVHQLAQVVGWLLGIVDPSAEENDDGGLTLARAGEAEVLSSDRQLQELGATPLEVVCSFVPGSDTTEAMIRDLVTKLRWDLCDD